MNLLHGRIVNLIPTKSSVREKIDLKFLACHNLYSTLRPIDLLTNEVTNGTTRTCIVCINEKY